MLPILVAKAHFADDWMGKLRRLVASSWSQFAVFRILRSLEDVEGIRCRRQQKFDELLPPKIEDLHRNWQSDARRHLTKALLAPNKRFAKIFSSLTDALSHPHRLLHFATRQEPFIVCTFQSQSDYWGDPLSLGIQKQLLTLSPPTDLTEPSCSGLDWHTHTRHTRRPLYSVAKPSRWPTRNPTKTTAMDLYVPTILYLGHPIR